MSEGTAAFFEVWLFTCHLDLLGGRHYRLPYRAMNAR
jgi:hypothetical protein